MLQAREDEKLEWQAVQNTLSGQQVQQVESRWFRSRKHRNQHCGANGSNGSEAESSPTGLATAMAHQQVSAQQQQVSAQQDGQQVQQQRQRSEEALGAAGENGKVQGILG